MLKIFSSRIEIVLLVFYSVHIKTKELRTDSWFGNELISLPLQIVCKGRKFPSATLAIKSMSAQLS